MEKCPITGLFCNKHKNISITDIGKDYIVENSYKICQSCSEISNEISNELSNELKSMLPDIIKNIFSLLYSIINKKQVPQSFVPLPPIEQPEAKPPCPSCGATIYYIAQTNKLGCPHCYEWYKDELTPVLIHAHKATAHVGKRPKNVSIEEQIYILEMQLKQAVEQEKYEDAIEIKNKINQLKNLAAM